MAEREATRHLQNHLRRRVYDYEKRAETLIATAYSVPRVQN